MPAVPDKVGFGRFQWVSLINQRLLRICSPLFLLELICFGVVRRLRQVLAELELLVHFGRVVLLAQQLGRLVSAPTVSFVSSIESVGFARRLPLKARLKAMR